jgi:hypothetical protein
MAVANRSWQELVRADMRSEDMTGASKSWKRLDKKACKSLQELVRDGRSQNELSGASKSLHELGRAVRSL